MFAINCKQTLTNNSQNEKCNPLFRNVPKRWVSYNHRLNTFETQSLAIDTHTHTHICIHTDTYEDTVACASTKHTMQKPNNKTKTKQKAQTNQSTKRKNAQKSKSSGENDTPLHDFEYQFPLTNV